MSQPERYLRFPLPRRIEHWVLVTSFLSLAITGLPQKYAQFAVSETVIKVLGGIETVRIIHRVSAVVLMMVGIYHLGSLLYRWYVERGRPSILPGPEDLRNAWQSLGYNLGWEDEPPKQDYFTFEEKFEYWALIWGTLIMILTGFFLWNPITAATLLPGQWIPAAKAAHGGEALLAVLSIILWHMYHVLVRHFNRSMFTGYLSRHEMQELHPLALERTELPPPTPEDPRYRRRRRQFTIGYGIVSVALLGVVFWFVTSEQTASASPEPPPDIQNIEVFSPLTPTPFPTSPFSSVDLSQFGTSWEDRIGALISDRCGACHNPDNGFHNLDLTSYEGALQGGDSGPAIVPGAPGISLLIVWQTRGEHPGEFSDLELAALREWILAGAPEN